MAHKDIVVRPPTSGEAGQIARLVHAHRCAERIDRDSDILVAELDGMVLGTIATSREGNDAFVHTFVVEHGLRGKGVEDALVEGLVQHARGEGITHIWVLPHVESTRFESHGFSAASNEGSRTAISNLRGTTTGASPSMVLNIATTLQNELPILHSRQL